MGSEIDTIAKRSRLAVRKNPFWTNIGGRRGGVSLGYRKAAKGPGSWIAKVVISGQRVEERLGVADDDGAVPGALPYRSAVSAALDWSRQQSEAFDARRASGSSKAVATVRTAIEDYSAYRLARSVRDGANAEARLKRHVLADAKFADTALSKLRASTIEAWRSRLSTDLLPTTANRLLNDLRAALNRAAGQRRRELSAHLPAEIRAGTKAGSAPTTARKQLLDDDQVRRIVDAAFTVGPDGDFGRLVMVAAATGARLSQITALKVRDLQAARARVMMPGSSKGRGEREKRPVAVPLSADVIARLLPAVQGRPEGDPLLTRWSYRRAGQLKWERDGRRAWRRANEIQVPWAAAVTAAELPADIVMYALRHSSIVRGLRAGLPIRLVAALHDTSTDMIEAHYSAHIVDMTEDLARRVALSMSAPVLEAAE